MESNQVLVNLVHKSVMPMFNDNASIDDVIKNTINIVNTYFEE